MQIEEKIKGLIQESLGKISVEADAVLLEHPTELSHGDYSSNIAMVCAKQVGKNPRELAEEIVSNIAHDSDIEKVEIAGPGFINFYLSKDFYKNTLEEISSTGDAWGKNSSREGKKVMVEYTDLNPFKAFHIGHLMPNSIGESIARLIEASGAEVKRANYHGDIGPHVAKTIWGLQQGQGSIESADGLGEAYAYGSKKYEEDEAVKAAINEINKAVYEKSDEEVLALYAKGRQVSLDYFESIYPILGSAFDSYYFESETWEDGIEVVKANVPNVFEESEGAIIFRGDNHDKTLHTRVFVNSQGLPTYEAKDIGLAKAKKATYDPDISIIITAEEQSSYFKVVKKAIEMIPEISTNEITHIAHGMMKLSTGKMSSRTGDVVKALDLITEVKNKAVEVMEERNIDNKEEVAEQIAIAAIKYSILRSHTGNDIVYDVEQSLSFEGDSGPYLQYAHTRANSILEKKSAGDNSGVNSGDTSSLEKLLYRYPEVVAEASEKYEPHHVVTYLTELAGAFNSFYANNKIIDSENESYNLALTAAFKHTMANGLHVLGIKAPKEM